MGLISNLSVAFLEIQIRRHRARAELQTVSRVSLDLRPRNRASAYFGETDETGFTTAQEMPELGLARQNTRRCQRTFAVDWPESLGACSTNGCLPSLIKGIFQRHV